MLGIGVIRASFDGVPETRNLLERIFSGRFDRFQGVGHCMEGIFCGIGKRRW